MTATTKQTEWSFGIPSGMVEVTHEQFFAYLKLDPRDIMPSHREPHHTTWETPNRVVVGMSWPGWKNPGEPTTYALTDAAFTSLHVIPKTPQVLSDRDGTLSTKGKQ